MKETLRVFHLGSEELPDKTAEDWEDGLQSVANESAGLFRKDGRQRLLSESPVLKKLVKFSGQINTERKILPTVF